MSYWLPFCVNEAVAGIAHIAASLLQALPLLCQFIRQPSVVSVQERQICASCQINPTIPCLRCAEIFFVAVRSDALILLGEFLNTCPCVILGVIINDDDLKSPVCLVQYRLYALPQEPGAAIGWNNHRKAIISPL